MGNIYLSEEELVERFQSDPSFGWLGYINHHSQEMVDDYKEFCQENSLPEEAESSASAFMDEREKIFRENVEN